MLKIIKESINPEELPKSLRRYAYIIEDFEYGGDEWYPGECWCYLIDGYKTSFGSGQIHDKISVIRSELRDIEKETKKKM